ncbi:hypothetical protein QBC35DRAFT_437640 [Podospora australis]|uniref:Uncharacterized protein n=1 Tax=Podospora australis TaxID=1536484 RepID=A0AAN6WU44_9PEZI|nr:hypothetical protein QBC35DRAFT_437640 [Podospora australis]
MEWTKQQYNTQYEKWVPWLEDLYLRYFTKDNKASYAAKENLDQTKVTGIQQVDTLQDGVHNLVAGQVGQGGLGRPVGDLASREGINRFERQGKDENGGYVPGADAASAVAGGVVDAGTKVGQGVGGGVKSAGGWLGFGGGSKGQEGQDRK